MGRMLGKSGLAGRGYETQNLIMTTKQIVQDLLDKLPEDASLHDVAREIEFVAAVRQGIADLDRGDCTPIALVEEELPSWVIR